MIVKRTIGSAALLFLVWSAFALGAGAIEGTRSLWVGDRAEPFVRHSVRGEARLWVPEVPTVTIFWARWSRPSLQALREIVAAAPRSAARWDIVPINVDRAILSPREATAVEAAARKAGYQGPVWHDAGFERTRHWGLVAVPTILITGFGGMVEAIEVGWATEQSRRFLSTYFGAVTDTSPPLIVDSLRMRCRRELGRARLLWRAGAHDSALAQIDGIRAACSTVTEQSLLQAWWRWEKGDTLPARTAARAAIRFDSLDPWSWVTLAAIEERCGRHEEALNLGRRAVSLDTGFTPGWLILARCALEMGDTVLARGAVSELEARCRHDPEFAAARARLRELAKEMPGAAADWRLATEGRLCELKERSRGQPMKR